jgi:hypothetical protein
MAIATNIDNAAGNDGHRPAGVLRPSHAEPSRPIVAGSARAAQDGQRQERDVVVVPLSLRERDCETLRPMVAAIERDLAGLRGQSEAEGYAESLGRLLVSWNTLVQSMALGEPPELRVCPHCQYRIRHQATRCIQCWKMSERSA